MRQKLPHPIVIRIAEPVLKNRRPRHAIRTTIQLATVFSDQVIDSWSRRFVSEQKPVY